MKVDTGKLQILTVAAILVLISGGIAAYAQNQIILADEHDKHADRWCIGHTQ